MTVIKKKKPTFKSNYKILNDIMNYEWRAAIYLRVSTFKQYQEGHSYDEQEKVLNSLCDRMNFAIYGVYGDPTVSGKEYEKRKDFQQLLDDIATGKVNVVVVWRLDRLVRGVENTQKLIKHAKKYNCRIVTSWNELDYQSAAGRRQINMDAAQSEYEVDVTSERTKLGLIGAIEAGHMPKKPPFGFWKDKASENPKQLRIHKLDMSWVLKLADWTLQGMSALQRSIKFDAEYPGDKKLTVSVHEDMWNNELYIAIYRHHALELETGQECIYDLSKIFPPPIDNDTWNQLQEQKSKNSLIHMKKQTYLFMGKIKCPCCGHDVLGGANGKGRNGVKHCYYRCNRCTATGYIKEEAIEELFIKEINDIIDYFIFADIGTIPIKNAPTLIGDAKVYEDQLNKLATTEQRVKNAYYQGFSNDDEFASEMRVIRLKQENLQNEIKKLKTRDIRITEDVDIDLFATIKEIYKRKQELYYTRTNDTWNTITKEQRQAIVLEYIDKIEIELDEKRNPIIKTINFRESKIDNLLYMFKNNIMDLTICTEDKNILISKTQPKHQIATYIESLQQKYHVNYYEVEVDQVKFDELDQNKVIKIMPQLNTAKFKKQRCTIITI